MAEPSSVGPTGASTPGLKLARGCWEGGVKMSERFGPFCGAAEGRAPLPRAAATLGLEFIDVNFEKGMIFSSTERTTACAGSPHRARLHRAICRQTRGLWTS